MVNILVRTLIGLTLFFLVSVGAAQAVQVTIDPSDYTGEWTVDYGPAQRGITLVILGKDAGGERPRRFGSLFRV